MSAKILSPLSLNLEGWVLWGKQLRWNGQDDENLEPLIEEVTEWVHEHYSLATLSSDPLIASLRRLFRRAGTDPTRYRPSSEALLRRLLKGVELTTIHPLVDFGNCLSARLAVPVCVMAVGSFKPPFSFRSGAVGETYQSLKGPLKLEGKPLLVDATGPCDTPITGNERVKILPSTRDATVVMYLPEFPEFPELLEESGEVFDFYLSKLVTLEEISTE